MFVMASYLYALIQSMIFCKSSSKINNATSCYDSVLSIVSDSIFSEMFENFGYSST